MARGTGYQTHQRDKISQILVANPGVHFTVDGILELLREQNAAVGKSTVYRYLERLSAEGKVRKFTAEGEKSVCYQYVGNDGETGHHYHLKCDRCGRLIHMECNTMDRFVFHIHEKHGFQLNAGKCTFHGICQACTKNGEKE